MIILNQKKIIIFHNKKTSGTTMGILMSIIGSKGDHITFHNVKLNVKKKLLKKIHFSKYHNIFEVIYIKSIKNIIRNLIIFVAKNLFKKKFQEKEYTIPYILYNSKYYGHITPSYFRKYINKKMYDDYSKFTIYRNFSDQIYSMYNHLMLYQKFITYDEWISKNLNKYFKQTKNFYSSDLYFFNYHNMEGSLKRFCKKFKISENLANHYKSTKLRSGYKKNIKKFNNTTKKKIQIKERIIYSMVRDRLLAK